MLFNIIEILYCTRRSVKWLSAIQSKFPRITEINAYVYVGEILKVQNQFIQKLIVITKQKFVIAEHNILLNL